jgi:hypothetical protein
MDILPSDDIIQKYMSYLDGRPVEEHVLDEIKEYEKRLAKRLENDEFKDNNLAGAVDIYNEAFNVYYYDQVLHVTFREWPPFPLLDMYANRIKHNKKSDGSF